MAVVAIEHIVHKPGDRPRIAGSGIKVRLIVEWVQAGASLEDIAAQHDLTLGQIHAALSYYYDHKEEMDREIAELRALSAEVAQTAMTTEKLRERIKQRGEDP